MLSRELLQQIRKLQILTGRQVADVLAGQYLSAFRGRGIEFNEVRPYVPGDEIRAIDWNVTARTGKPFVKRYMEERQLTLMMMADISPSQDFGSQTRSKRDATAELCALLAFSASSSDDKVGLALFHGGIEQYIPPRKGQKHSLRVVREVLAHGAVDKDQTRSESPQRKRWLPFGKRRFPRKSQRQSTNISGAMQFLMSVSVRRTVCFVISDFQDDHFISAMQSANRRHDVIAVLMKDPRERDIPNVGLVRLKDSETGQTRIYDSGSAGFRQSVQVMTDQRIESLRKMFYRSDIDFIEVDVTQSLVSPLIEFFRMRQKRIHR